MLVCENMAYIKCKDACYLYMCSCKAIIQTTVQVNKLLVQVTNDTAQVMSCKLRQNFINYGMYRSKISYIGDDKFVFQKIMEVAAVELALTLGQSLRQLCL